MESSLSSSLFILAVEFRYYYYNINLSIASDGHVLLSSLGWNKVKEESRCGHPFFSLYSTIFFLMREGTIRRPNSSARNPPESIRPRAENSDPSLYGGDSMDPQRNRVKGSSPKKACFRADESLPLLLAYPRFRSIPFYSRVL